MLVPMMVSLVFVVVIVALCLYRPNVGRLALGGFFLLMAVGVNGSFTFGNPQAYVHYARSAPIPFYRELAVAVVSLSPRFFGLLVLTFELVMALCLMHKGKSVKIGLVGTMLFLVGIAPLGLLQIPWLGLIAGELHLMRQQFDRSPLEELHARLGLRALSH